MKKWKKSLKNHEIEKFYMRKILIDRIELFLKSIPKSKFLTFLGIPVHLAALKRGCFIFPLPNRTSRTPWFSFEKKCDPKNSIQNDCISPRYALTCKSS